MNILIETRKIDVAPAVKVSSAWAIPEDCRGGSGSAVILAHGAGNDMHHPFMDFFHRAFAEAGLLSIKFNFPYTEQGRKAPDRMPLLESTWQAMIHSVREDKDLAPRRLFLAGKSMGGRVASHCAAQGAACDGLIFLGYPLHPAKQPDKRRVDHWGAWSCPVLFVQGTRDALCGLEILKAEWPRIAAPAALHVVDGGDHSFKVPKSAGKTQEAVWGEAAEAVLRWMAGREG